MPSQKTAPAKHDSANGNSDAPAVDRMLDILECLSAQPEGFTLSELCGELRLPKNSVFRITNVLIGRGYIGRDDKLRRFTLTSKFLNVMQPRYQQRSLVEVALEHMRQLRDQTRETVQLGILSGLEGVILEQVESLYPLRISVDVGLRFKLYNNAPGKLLLAHLAERNAVIQKMELLPCTSRTITSKDELRRECERIITQGFSVDHAEADEGIHCIAAPVFGKQQQMQATIWISGPSRRLPKDSFAGHAKLVMDAAARISERLRV